LPTWQSGSPAAAVRKTPKIIIHSPFFRKWLFPPPASPAPPKSHPKEPIMDKQGILSKRCALRLQAPQQSCDI